MAPWETLIAGVNTWTRGTERAVHKPLLVLMILGRAQRGGPANVLLAFWRRTMPLSSYGAHCGQ